MNDELPQGWATATLADVLAEMKTGPFGSALHKSDYVTGGIPVINPVNIVDGKIQPSEDVAVSKETFTRLRDYALQADDIILARRGEMGRCAVVTESEVGCLCGTGSAVLRLNDSALPAFVQKLISSPSVRAYLSDASVGTTMDNLNQRMFKAMPLALPPLPEQRRIVAKLETLLGKVDASQQRLAKIPVLLKRFRQSVLAAACSGRLTDDWREENPNVDDASWLVEELERIHEAAGGHKKGNAAEPSDEAHDLSADDLPSTWRLTEMRSVVCPDRPITYGILKPGPETPDGILYVRVADFPNDRLNLETIRRTTKEIEKTFARARLRAGDILLSIRGTVGRVCVVPPELENANITQDTARLSVQPALNAGFVKWFLRAAPTQKRMQKAVKGVAVRGINIGDVRALQMPVPPLPEQQEIVRRVEGLFALADQLQERLAKARGQVDKLTPSLLARAFAGQLVPQDPTDEPAGKLLECIRNPAKGKR
jgi:type I restriction enzyme S subunit